jgi:hypothetical protein
MYGGVLADVTILDPGPDFSQLIIALGNGSWQDFECPSSNLLYS